MCGLIPERPSTERRTFTGELHAGRTAALAASDDTGRLRDISPNRKRKSMAQSVFAANATQFIDGVDQDSAPPGIWNLGVEFLGTSKAFVRRCLAAFDLFRSAASGRRSQPATSSPPPT